MGQKDISWIKCSKAFEKALEKKIEKCAPPPQRVLALKISKPCHCSVSICRPHTKRGGNLFNRIRLKHQLHVFAHSTSDWFYFNLVKHVHNFGPSGWVSFKSVCRHVQKVTLKSLSERCTLCIPLNVWPAKSISMTGTVDNIKSVGSKLKSLIVVI